MKSYDKSIIPLARRLRRNMTPWEKALWYNYLRDYPIRFQRQKTVGSYIADFYCAKAGLVIELDGGGHYEPEQIETDNTKTSALNSLGLRVLRFCNLDIDNNLTGVCEAIDMAVKSSCPLPANNAY